MSGGVRSALLLPQHGHPGHASSVAWPSWPCVQRGMAILAMCPAWHGHLGHVSSVAWPSWPCPSFARHAFKRGWACGFAKATPCEPVPPRTLRCRYRVGGTGAPPTTSLHMGGTPMPHPRAWAGRPCHSHARGRDAHAKQAALELSQVSCYPSALSPRCSCFHGARRRQ